MKKILTASIIAALVILSMAEGAARIAFDFPLYGADKEVGYWPLPNQNGSFLSNTWVFNTESMGVGEDYAPSKTFDVLLVGDSIVYGGNELSQPDKLAPVMESKTGWQVWPVAAGSWALQNELAFLRRKPDLVEGADVVVVIMNSGDFGEPSEWRSRYTHPRERPQLFLPYLFKRYVWKEDAVPPSPFPVAQRDVLSDWVNLVKGAGVPVVAVAYSNQAESGQACNWVPSKFTQVGHWVCYDGLVLAGFNGFRDIVHPSPDGNRKLADFIIDVLNQTNTANRQGAVPGKALHAALPGATAKLEPAAP